MNPVPKRLLIVEDDTDVRLMLRSVLEHEGYHVNVLDDGMHIREAVTAHAPDAILLDVMMPVRDGVGALTDLSRVPTRPPVLVLSAYLPQDKGEALVAPWGAEYLAKPFDLETLFVRLAALVDGADRDHE